MTFPYKLAAIDLDDTLLGPDKIIGPENAEAVARLTRAGVQCVLASGRRHENMTRYARLIGLIGPVVSCNGALVKIDRGEVLHEKLVPPPLAAQIVAEGDARGITQNYYHIRGGLYVREENAWTDLYEGRTGSRVIPHPPLTDFGGEGCLKVLWVDNHERITALQAELTARYGDRLYITTTDPEYLEFMALGVSKAVGVEVVAHHFGVNQHEVLTFGDGNNDVEMLQWAGLGVAVGHARPAARAAADLIADEGNPETAFARAVEKVFAHVANSKHKTA